MIEVGRKWPADVASTINSHYGSKWGLEDQHIKHGGPLFVAHSLRADGFDASKDGTGRGTPLVPISFHGSQDPDPSGDVTHPLGRNQGREACVAFAQNQRGEGYPAIRSGMQVRRLTPLECCRLQGFPDHYLDIEYRGRPAADGPKYKALGNSMAVNVMRWIGERITSIQEPLKP